MLQEEFDGQLRMRELDPLEGRNFTVRKRDGRIVPFDESRILLAIESAFRANSSLNDSASLPDDQASRVQDITEAVVKDCISRALSGQLLEIELIQDAVEEQLMHHAPAGVARRFIIYREDRRKQRALRGEKNNEGQAIDQIFITKPDGSLEPLDPQRIRRQFIKAVNGYEKTCDWQLLSERTLRGLYNGVSVTEIEDLMINEASARIEMEPDYDFVASRLLLNKIYREVLGSQPVDSTFITAYREKFPEYIHSAIGYDRLDPRLLEFDLKKLAQALKRDRDNQFSSLGLQTLYDRYFIHEKDLRLETPQYFWMRVAMGLSLLEGDQKNERAIEFYNLLSTFRFISSTPTLFNSGTVHPQLSSCYLSTVMDDLSHIFKVISDDAKLSKWAGGLGNDWTNVRATNARIKGTNGTSQGIIPFLKVANDTAVAVNQGGKRRGAMCAYLETWHLDLKDFLELRKNTGDERRRTHDMNTANWIPDLFMKRVKEKGKWTFFNPSDTPDLHDLYGQAFEKRYAEYEKMAEDGQITQFQQMDAVAVWRKMLMMVFETGHPWMTFKDPSNVRSPQDHTGVVHSSNLCTEILLNTSEDETAVCNLGSVNLAGHIVDGQLDAGMLHETVTTAMRMLDNVIDINFYPIPEAKNANLRHRPVGLGLMGFQDALYKLRIPYASNAAVEFADLSMEHISYAAIMASTELARERGAYESFKGSKWDRGLLPIDTIDLLEKERGGFLQMDRSTTLDWNMVREAVRTNGMRNSNTMAIAPTATISNICGVSQSIEPAYKHLYAKSNLSGEFISINRYLVDELKERGLWNRDVVDEIKYFDGSISQIESIPEDIRQRYLTSFEVHPKWLILCASRRQKWIDMGQSLNLYIPRPDGETLSQMYLFAWENGLKTTYYLRSLGATSVEHSSRNINKGNRIKSNWMKSDSLMESRVRNTVSDNSPAMPKSCSIDNPDCESCQ